MKAHVYTRPDKPFFIPVTRRRNPAPVIDADPAALPQPVTVHGSTDCFVTPPAVAARMADYAELQNGLIVCDPEAGTGHLLEAALNTEKSITLFGNELNAELYRHLQQRFDGLPCLTLTQGDFLANPPAAAVDRFIMNPPYSRRQAYKHINHARQHLAPEGRIIAVVPCTFELDGMQELEPLPAGTFAGTEVRTKIIEISA